MLVVPYHMVTCGHCCRLSYTYGNEMHHTAREAVDRSRTVFGAHALSILSNSAGTSDDVDHRMALETEAALGLPVIRHRAKKPDCLDEVQLLL